MKNARSKENARPGATLTSDDALTVFLVGGTSKSDLWAASENKLWHFDGSSWSPPFLAPLDARDPAEQRLVTLTRPLSAYAPDDVWVAGHWRSLESFDPYPYVAHYDGTSWVERSPLAPFFLFGSLPNNWLAATGPDEAYIGLVSSSGPPPAEGDLPSTVPELYRWAEGWQSVALPGAQPVYLGADGVAVAARGPRLYVGLNSAQSGMPKLLVRESDTWSSLDAPVFGVTAIHPTATSLWVEGGGSALGAAPDFIWNYGSFFPFFLGIAGEHFNRGSGLLRLREAR